MSDPHPYFDPNDPFAPLPPKPPASLPTGRVHSGPGKLHFLLTVASVVGLVICTPILFQLRKFDEETPITGPLVLEALGFVFSLVVFAGTLGVRAVHWLAGTFVNLIFNMDGNGWTWEEQRRMRKEAEERAAAGPPKRRIDPDA